MVHIDYFYLFIYLFILKTREQVVGGGAGGRTGAKRKKDI